MSRSPLYTGAPVVVVHMGTDETDAGRQLAACTGERFDPVGTDYPKVPRVPCPGCWQAMRRAGKPPP